MYYLTKVQKEPPLRQLIRSEEHPNIRQRSRWRTQGWHFPSHRILRGKVDRSQIMCVIAEGRKLTDDDVLVP